MGVATGCGCDFLLLLIPTPLVSVRFYSSIPTFCSFFILLFSFLFQYIPFCNYILCINKFFLQYKHTYEQLQVSHSSHMKAAHNVLYMKKYTQTYVSYPRWISAV